MVLVQVRPGQLGGSLRPPSSLPLARAMLWAACLGNGGVIGRVPDHPHIPLLLDFCRAWGAEGVVQDGVADILVHRAFVVPSSLSCRRDPLLSRLSVPLALLTGQPATLTDLRLPLPAAQWLDGAARTLGVRVLKTADRLEVSGAPERLALELSDRPGAFWAPGLILAAPLAASPFVLPMDEFVSAQPSVRMSMAVAEKLGIAMSWDELGPTLAVAPGQSYAEINAEVEPDWRTGSYLLGALALAAPHGRLSLPLRSVQPERAFWAPLEQAGLFSWNAAGDEISVRAFSASRPSAPSGLSSAGLPLRFSSASADRALPRRPGLYGGSGVRPASSAPAGASRPPSSSLSSFEPLPLPASLDLRRCPALYPLALVLATRAAQPVRLEPLYPLSPRSSWRIRHTARQLSRLGADIRTSEGVVEVRPDPLSGGECDCGRDSRIAMALGLAGLISKEPVLIAQAESVAKAAPSFWTDLRLLGADVRADYSRQTLPSFAPVPKA